MLERTLLHVSTIGEARDARRSTRCSVRLGAAGEAGRLHLAGSLDTLVIAHHRERLDIHHQDSEQRTSIGTIRSVSATGPDMPVPQTETIGTIRAHLTESPLSDTMLGPDRAQRMLGPTHSSAVTG